MLPRADAVAALASEPFDVLVIGGGITGAGVALDAATRGYSVALVEKADYAAGTSSRSSKLVHGGLRYLQNFDLGLVREALLERQINAALAPHLVRPLPMIVPAFEGARLDRLLGLGLNLGTLVGASVIIESIFSLPGSGQALLQAINNRDILVVEAIVLVLAVVVVLSNLITDLLYAVLDPRIRYERSGT